MLDIFDDCYTSPEMWWDNEVIYLGCEPNHRYLMVNMKAFRFFLDLTLPNGK